jgi:DNA polymerase III epsilon subunit-like protein
MQQGSLMFPEAFRKYLDFNKSDCDFVIFERFLFDVSTLKRNNLSLLETAPCCAYL